MQRFESSRPSLRVLANSHKMQRFESCRPSHAVGSLTEFAELAEEVDLHVFQVAREAAIAAFAKSWRRQ
jgi:hypothetical protein